MKRILFLLCALLAFVGGTKATEVVYSTTTGSFTATNSGGTWASKWVSTATNPQVTISVGANNIQVSSGNIYSGGSGCTYTIATEGGYMITGYTIVGKAQTAAQTLTPKEGGEAVTFNTDQDYTLTVSGIATQATSFTQSTPNNGIAITSFTITVVENPDYVDPFTLLSNEKAYKLTCPRGTLGVFDNTLVSTMQGYEASNFAVLKYNEAFYLYSIAAKRFINGSALASNYNLTAVDLQLQSDGSFLLVYNGQAINNNNTGTFMSTWGVSTGTPDDGNKFTIAEVEGETFDPTEALAILANPPAVPTYTYITSADNISNEKAYIVTNARGTWNVSTGADKMTTKSAIDLEALYEQFALIKKNDLIYIYSVNAKKFLTSSNTLGDPEAVTITSTGNDSYPFFFSFDASHNINVNGAGTVLIDTWSTIDGGNSNAIIEAADFDATEALAQLNTYLLSQTWGDITEYILANPSFELSAADTPLTEEKKASNGALDIYGWTMEGVGNQFNNTEILTESTAGTSGKFGASAPSDGTYSFFYRQSWNPTAGNLITLKATPQTDLPAGFYKLSVDFKQAASSDSSHPSGDTNVTLSVVSTDATLAQETSGNAGSQKFADVEWSTITTLFSLEETAKPVFSVQLKAAGGVISEFRLDNVRLVKVSEAEFALMALNAALEPANATVTAKANVGDDLFQIPTAAFDTYKTAVAEQQAVAEKADATAEELQTALAALNAATEAYNATEVNKPDAGKFYTLQLKDGGMYMALNEGTKLAAEPTILSFEAVEGGYALTDGTSYVACTGTGSNVWSMAASTTPYAWQFAALGDGYYTIAKASNASHCIGVNETTAGSSCFADKAVSDKSTWKLAEFVPTPTLIEGVAQLNLTQKDDYYGDTELGTVYSGDLTAAVTTVNSSTDITLKNVQYTLNMYGMEQTHQVGNITFAGLAVDAEGNIDDTNVSVSFADGDIDGTWEAAAHTATSATVEGTLIGGKLAATFNVVADFTESDPDYGDMTYSLIYAITFGDELPSFEYTREGLTVGNFGTIVLNFTPEATTGISQLYSIAGKVSDEGGNPLYIVLQEETAIEAGVPYIFQADATTITATAPGTAASVTEPKNYEIDWDTYMPTYYNNGLQGTFTATTADDQAYTNMVDNIYLLAGGKIVKAAAESTLAANRAFIVMEAVPEVTGDVKGLRIYLNDTTTGIQATKSADGKTVIFNLAGQRLQNAQKGINIVRGKKVLVK